MDILITISSPASATNRKRSTFSKTRLTAPVIAERKCVVIHCCELGPFKQYGEIVGAGRGKAIEGIEVF